MAYCVHCGVKLSKEAKACPLCATPIIDPNLLGPGKLQDLSLSGDILPTVSPLSGRLSYHRGILGGLFTFICIIALATTLTVDLSVNRRISWSFYTMSSITTLWAIAIFPFLYRRKSTYSILISDAIILSVFLILLDNHDQTIYWAWFAVCGLMTIALLILLAYVRTYLSRWLIYLLGYVVLSGMLCVFDLLTPAHWFLSLALPILTLSITCGYLIHIWYRHALRQQTKHFGYLLTAFIFISIILISLLVNILTLINIGAKPLISWSLIVLGSSMPLILFCFIAYFDNRLSRMMNKKFRI